MAGFDGVGKEIGVDERAAAAQGLGATDDLHDLGGDLLLAGAKPKGPAELVTVLRELGYVVEAQAPERPGRAWALDVVVTEIH